MLFSMYGGWKCSMMVGNSDCFLEVLDYALLLGAEGIIWMNLEAMMQMVVRC